MQPRRQRLALPAQTDLAVESPYAPITIPPAARLLLERSTAIRPRCRPLPHQDMNISQAERGGNGESIGVVNQWLLSQTVGCRRADVSVGPRRSPPKRVRAGNTMR